MLNNLIRITNLSNFYNEHSLRLIHKYQKILSADVLASCESTPCFLLHAVAAAVDQGWSSDDVSMYFHGWEPPIQINKKCVLSPNI